MKRIPTRGADHHETQSPHLNVHKAALILIPLLVVTVFYGLFPSFAYAQENTANGLCPPATRKDGTVESIHGMDVADPYRWLEDQNSPETRSWIDEQDRCPNALLDSVPRRAQIAKRLTERLKRVTFTTS